MPASKKTTPAPQAAKPTGDDRYQATAWGSDVGGLQDLEMPSGQLALVRRPGVQGLIEAGVLHDLDSLSSLVDAKHVKKTAKGKKDELDVAKLMQDPDSLGSLMHTVDRVMVHVVVKPELQMTPNDVTRRQPGVIYADMVDLVDKLFIFNFVVGGTRDLERFRGGLDEGLGRLEAGEGVSNSSV